MTLLDYPVFLVAGLSSYFDGPVLATPFLLDLMRLLKDMMQLLFASGAITARLGDALAVMHFIALATITAWVFKIRWPALLRGLAIRGGIGFVCLLGIRTALAATFAGKFSESDVLAGMDLIKTPVLTNDVEPGPNPTPLSEEGGLACLRNHGSLRVGLVADRIPFSCRNAKGEWVGYDVELAHELARTLDLEPELMSLRPDQVGPAVGDRRYVAGVREWFRDAQVVEATASSFLRWLSQSRHAHHGCGVRLPLEPAPPGVRGREPAAAHLEGPRRNGGEPRYPRLPDFLSRLIDRLDWTGTSQRLYDHPVLGKDLTPNQPRWSVIRDLLGWVD